MTTGPHISFVIPARDEATRLGPTLDAYRRGLDPNVELVVVVNGSRDATARVAREAALRHGGIDVVEIQRSIGKGGAVREGFRRARGTWVGFLDADLATPVEDVRRLITAAAAADGAIASRFAPGARVVGRIAGRTIASRAFAALVRALLALPFADTQCGAKLFHRRFLDDYLARAVIRDLAFDVELLVILTRAGARIAEVPATWIARPGSAVLGTPLGFLVQGARMARSVGVLWWRARRRAP
jgi:glycosyltransferase involved in cell wall biosynthesis